MDNSTVDVLPAVQAGCDTTSKVGTNFAAFQAVMKCGYDLFCLFGKSEISDQIILSAKTFLIGCISKKSERNNFDDIQFERYHQKLFQLDFEKLPLTLSSIHIHIKQAFVQCYLLLDKLLIFVESTEINLEDYEL